MAIKSGSFILDGKTAMGTVTVDMTTIKNDDVETEKYKKKLEGHLKSADFFDVEKHPTAKFVLKKADAKGSDKYSFMGDLTIKGITKPAQFTGTLKQTKTGSHLVADLTFDRSQYDIKYRSKSFFDPKSPRRQTDT